MKELIDIRKFSSLTKVIRVVAWVWRAAIKWKGVLAKTPATSKPKWEGLSSEEIKSRAKQAVLIISEYDSQRDLFLAAQEGASFQDTTPNRLVVYKDAETGLLVCG